MNKKLDIYIATDQPETCRRCGRRTDCPDINANPQRHTCPECGYTYLVEWEEVIL